MEAKSDGRPTPLRVYWPDTAVFWKRLNDSIELTHETGDVQHFSFKSNHNDLDMEELELELIDFGVEEIFNNEDEEEPGVMIYAPFESFGNIQSYLEDNNIEIISSGFERIPQITKKLSPEQAEDVEKLIEKLEEDDDVQNVYHTMEESSEG